MRTSKVTDNLELLRQSWLEAAAMLAPYVPTVSEVLTERLAAAGAEEHLDESTLLRAVADAASAAEPALSPEAAAGLARRLERNVYEYLLSLDAYRPQEEKVWPAEAPAPVGEGTVLIGAEEVAALRGEQPAAAEEAAAQPETPAEAVAPAEPVAPAEAVAPPEPAQPEAVVVEPPAAAGAVESPEPSTADEAEDADAVPETPAQKKERRRLRIFGRRKRAAQADIPQTAPEGDDTPPVAPASELEQAAANPEAFPPLIPQHDPADGPYVVPRDGFHIRDNQQSVVISAPTDLGTHDGTPPHLPELVQAAVADTEPLPEKGWRVRQQARDGKRRRRGGDAKQAPSDHDDEGDFDTDAVIEARKQIDDRLRRRRCDEAAGMIQRMARDNGGHAVAELALDAGDRCRALGKGNAALSCYLAAARADPVYDAPLLRLVDVCLDDHDIDLAVSYLERVARLHRLRGDHRGALRIYRKIATVAPNRDDILNVLIRAQATGRFDD